MRNRNSYIEGLGYELPHPARASSNRLLEQYETDAYKDNNGVLRWKSNNHVPPQEVLDFWKYVGKRFNMSKCVAARNREDKIFLKEYRKQEQNRKYSQEELFEMEAAFGKGTVVVDVITGKKTRL